MIKRSSSYLTILAATLLMANAVELKQGPSGDMDWWLSALIYQINTPSFKDSDSDGIGDLNGITSKLPYLAETGVDAILLTPIFKSPMYDFGYDITDFKEIAAEYGTMVDFDNLLAEAKKIGIRVILDYVPNHTSNESDWFVKSTRREPPYENYYVWADGVRDKYGHFGPPNNWISKFGKSAWEYSLHRSQYYLHHFATLEPDLNYREPRVQREMKEVLRFWLDKGVSGFRISALNYVVEADPLLFGGRYPDEPLTGNTHLSHDDYNSLDHIYTTKYDVSETFDLLNDWRYILSSYTEKESEYKIMLADIFKTNHSRGVHKFHNTILPLNYLFLNHMNSRSTAHTIKAIIYKWVKNLKRGQLNWMVKITSHQDVLFGRVEIVSASRAEGPVLFQTGSHDYSRVATRLGPKYVDALNMLVLLLPGITITYQGEEIGQADGNISFRNTKDQQACSTFDPVNYWKKSRDPTRTPYQWDSSPNAGFSNTTDSTWLPVADNYKTLNLAAQQTSTKSHYKFYKTVAALKKTPAVRFGGLNVTVLSDNVLVVMRLLRGIPVLVGITSLRRFEVLDLSVIESLPHQLYVIAAGAECAHDIGTKIHKKRFPVSGTVVLEASPRPDYKTTEKQSVSSCNSSYSLQYGCSQLLAWGSKS